MKCSIFIVAEMLLLVAVVLMFAGIGTGTDNVWEEAETQPSMDDIDRVHVDRDDIDRVDIDRVHVDRDDIDRVDTDRVDIDRVDIDRVDVDTVDIDRVDVDRDDVGMDGTDMDDKGNVRRQSSTLCGRRPAITTDVYEPPPMQYYTSVPRLNKILGGSFATRGEVPWQANIYVDGVHRCGGAIINEFWVLTSAECVQPWNGGDVTIVVGDHYMSVVDEGEQTFDSSVHINGNHSDGSNDHNTALLKVITTSNGVGIQYNDYVQPICLPEETSPAPGGHTLLVSGWGSSSATSNESSDILKKEELRTTDRVICNSNTYPHPQENSIERLMCAESVSRDSNLCNGDRGAPGAIRHSDGYFLYGIMSNSTGCHGQIYPVLFSHIPGYRLWISGVLFSHSTEVQRVLPSVN